MTARARLTDGAHLVSITCSVCALIVALRPSPAGVPPELPIEVATSTLAALPSVEPRASAGKVEPHEPSPPPRVVAPRRPPPRESTPASSAVAPAAVPAVDPAPVVRRLLASHGLERADLELLPAVRVEVERYEAQEGPRNSEDLAGALDGMVAPTSLFRRKLDHIRDRLRARSTTLDPNVLTRLEEQYLRLEAELAKGPDAAAARRLLRELGALKAQLN